MDDEISTITDLHHNGIEDTEFPEKTLIILFRDEIVDTSAFAEA